MIRSFIIQSAIELMERGLIPDQAMRLGMKTLCGGRLKEKTDWQAERNRFVRESTLSEIAPLPEKANQQHYELPAEFFEIVLGSRRKYSCCYWPNDVDTLDAAEVAALEVTCQRAEIAPNMQVLELGCGWGSLTLWMAENYEGLHVTAVSNSQSQREYIERQAENRGLSDRITVITADMNDFDTTSKFDRVVSIEMFEHMRNHARLLERVARWLSADGKLFVHVFCHREQVYAFIDEGPASWMTRNFFTGGMMPSRDLLTQYDQVMHAEAEWEWNGMHYKKTQDAWLKQLDENRERVIPIMQQTYGTRNAIRWFHRWRMFFLACSELFGYDNGREWFVAHYLFAPNASRAFTASESATA